MPALVKYLLLQIPGWVLVGGLLVFLVSSSGLSPRWAALFFGLWLVKDLVLFPLVRVGYEPGDPSASARLLGALGTARERLDPEGYVRVGSELWRARVAEGGAAIEPHTQVRVVAVQDLTLRVEPA